MQVQGALHNLRQIDPALAGRRRTRKIRQVLHNLCRAPGLLLQHAELLARGFIRLRVLQQFTTPKMLVSGLFSSCATPPIIAPIAASRSLCTTCCSSFLSIVMSRTETITPVMFPSARPASWLPEARIVRQLPVAVPQAPNSADPKTCLPETMSLYNEANSGEWSARSVIFFPSMSFWS